MILNEDLFDETVLVDNALENLLITTVNKNWDLIADFNSVIVTLKDEGYEEYIELLNSIVEEEHNHIGKLQTIIETISPNASEISVGKQEAEELIAESPVDESLRLTEGNYPDYLGSEADFTNPRSPLYTGTEPEDVGASDVLSGQYTAQGTFDGEIWDIVDEDVELEEPAYLLDDFDNVFDINLDDYKEDLLTAIWDIDNIDSKLGADVVPGEKYKLEFDFHIPYMSSGSVEDGNLVSLDYVNCDSKTGEITNIQVLPNNEIVSESLLKESVLEADIYEWLDRNYGSTGWKTKFKSYVDRLKNSGYNTVNLSTDITKAIKKFSKQVKVKPQVFMSALQESLRNQDNIERNKAVQKNESVEETLKEDFDESADVFYVSYYEEYPIQDGEQHVAGCELVSSEEFDNLEEARERIAELGEEDVMEKISDEFYLDRSKYIGNDRFYIIETEKGSEEKDK